LLDKQEDDEEATNGNITANQVLSYTAAELEAEREALDRYQLEAAE
jgi:hypothetical protein